jgi:hypothetical protein
MTLFQLLVNVPSLVALIALFARGRAPERVTGCAIIIVTLAPLLLEDLEAGNIRWALAIVSIAFLGLLIGLAMRVDRWWLLAAAGIQLVSTASYAAALAAPDIMIYSGVAFRRVLWVELMAACLFGAWEARRLAPRQRHEHRYG